MVGNIYTLLTIMTIAWLVMSYKNIKEGLRELTIDVIYTLTIPIKIINTIIWKIWKSLKRKAQ